MANPRPSILFLHAHPDDEAIFTGGTIARLTDAGAAVSVVIATDDGSGPVRRIEAEAAAAVLKIDRLDFLGYRDSGLGPDLRNDTFAAADRDEAARRVAAIAAEVDADAIVTYDSGGIYGHPDHLAVHRVGCLAAELAEVKTLYQSTVDREHLHFVATHVVGAAVEALMRATGADRPEGLHPDPLAVEATDPSAGDRFGARPRPDGKLAAGMPTVLIDTAVDVDDVLERKRAAMAAHASQIPPDSDVLSLDPATFAAVYGLEWFLRSGPVTVLDQLANR